MPKSSAARSSAASKTQLVEREISRYPVPVQPRMRTLARLSQRYADLVWSYPAAAYALASGYLAPAPHGNGFKAVHDGLPLDEVGRHLGLPPWTRRLIPECFARTGSLAALPGGEGFDRGVRHHAPRRAEGAANWLHWVVSGARHADEEFALWLAAKRFYTSPEAAAAGPALLAIFAFLSREDGSAARRLIRRPFVAEMSFAAAVEALAAFVAALRIGIAVGEGTLAGTWLAAGEAQGYSFVPLVSLDDLVREAGLMRNCILDYTDRVANGECRLFGVRRHGEPVATLEVRPMALRSDVPVIVQLVGARNRPVGVQVWRAAFAWLGSQDRFALPQGGRACPQSHDDRVWRDVFAGYWRAKGSSVLVPEAPQERTLQRFDERVAALRRLAACGEE